ncbi:hypothetical protein BH20ACT6_BH20ACT6_14330 [soil metagenome]
MGRNVHKPDRRVHDEAVLAEIELTGALMIAASEHEGPLSQTEVDDLLGVTRPGLLRA